MLRHGHRTAMPRIEDFGRHHVVSVALGEQKIQVKVAEGPVPAIGDESRVTLSPADGRLFAGERAVS